MNKDKNKNTIKITASGGPRIPLKRNMKMKYKHKKKHKLQIYINGVVLLQFRKLKILLFSNFKKKFKIQTQM